MAGTVLYGVADRANAGCPRLSGAGVPELSLCCDTLPTRDVVLDSEAAQSNTGALATTGVLGGTPHGGGNTLNDLRAGDGALPSSRERSKHLTRMAPYSVTSTSPAQPVSSGAELPHRGHER